MELRSKRRAVLASGIYIFQSPHVMVGHDERSDAIL